MMNETAEEIRNDRDNGRILIKWADGERREYFYDDLRNACPCASCRGHVPGEVEPPDVHGVTVLNISAVGHYAIRFDFSDGHNTGLFEWAMLRRHGQTFTV